MIGKNLTRPFRGIGLGLLSLVFVLPSGANAALETNRELTQSFVNYYLQQREYQAAQQFLSDHLREDPKDAGSWNLLGLTFLRTRDNAKASQSFYRAVSQAAADDPNRGLYVYHYADALVRSGDEEKARLALKQVQEDPLVASTVVEALANLKPKQPLPEIKLRSDTIMRGTLSLSTGYDTNVLLTSDASLEAIDASDTASPFVVPAAQLTIDMPAFGSRMGINGVAAFTYETNTSAQRFNSLYGQIEAVWGPPTDENARWRWTVANAAEGSMVNLDGFGLFNVTDTLTYALVWRHGGRNQTEFRAPVGYAYFPLEDAADEADDRTGLQITPGLTHRAEMGPGIIEIGASYEHDFAAGDNFTANIFEFPVSWSQPILGNWTAKAEGALSLVSYPDSSDERSDTLIKAGYQMGRMFGPSIFGSASYEFRRNSSTTEAATYSRHSISLLVTYSL